MMVSHFRYVVHKLIPDYEALGWENTGDLRGTHHSEYADLMMWSGDGDPPEPPEVLARREQALAAHMLDVDAKVS